MIEFDHFWSLSIHFWSILNFMMKSGHVCHNDWFGFQEFRLKFQLKSKMITKFFLIWLRVDYIPQAYNLPQLIRYFFSTYFGKTYHHLYSKMLVLQIICRMKKCKLYGEEKKANCFGLLYFFCLAFFLFLDPGGHLFAFLLLFFHNNRGTLWQFSIIYSVLYSPRALHF